MHNYVSSNMKYKYQFLKSPVQNDTPVKKKNILVMGKYLTQY